ncbi:MAG: response regulator [Burkholderiaceae bacterium]
MPEPTIPPLPGGQDADGCRILVVDDDTDARESLGMLLELDGHEVAYARDGAEAIRRELEFEPALVLLDLGLPDIGGADVARRMRERGSTARIVALSGAPGDDTAALFDAQLTKPAKVEDLTAYLP